MCAKRGSAIHFFEQVRNPAFTVLQQHAVINALDTSLHQLKRRLRPRLKRGARRSFIRQIPNNFFFVRKRPLKKQIQKRRLRQLLALIAKAIQINAMRTLIVIKEILRGNACGIRRAHRFIPDKIAFRQPHSDDTPNLQTALR